MNLIIRKAAYARTIALVMIFALVGCTTLVRGVTQGFAEGLSSAILDNEDAVMVRDGAPSGAAASTVNGLASSLIMLVILLPVQV